jgi:phage/plasmid-associated DNA primase
LKQSQTVTAQPFFRNSAVSDSKNGNYTNAHSLASRVDALKYAVVRSLLRNTNRDLVAVANGVFNEHTTVRKSSAEAFRDAL